MTRRRGAAEHIHALPAEAVAAVGALLGHLCDGDGVAVLAQTQALSPNDAARVLGISRPLVVHRMAVGDLPFRYVGQHRRATLKDVLALKAKLETESAALSALAEDSDELHQLYGV